MEKFCDVIPLGPKIITANTLNVKPIFECSLLEFVGRTPVSDEVWVSKPLPFFSMCKDLRGQHPLGVEIWSSEKSI